jgi:hypothetical protein
MVATLLLWRMWEMQASDTDPWDGAWASCHACRTELSTPPSFALVFVFWSGCNVHIHTHIYKYI